jgi:hypothetical protein
MPVAAGANSTRLHGDTILEKLVLAPLQNTQKLQSKDTCFTKIAILASDLHSAAGCG